MNKQELKQLERDLVEDFVYHDDAVTERVRGLVKKFLMHEAGLLVGKQVRDEKQILELIKVHARVELLRKLITNPTGFNAKDMKELFRTINEEDDASKLGENVNPLAFIRTLNVPDDVKARMTQAAIELASQNMRAELGKGGGS